MKIQFLITSLLTVSFSLLAPSCSRDIVETPPIPPVSTLSIADVANFGNGRDMEVTFSKVTNEELISEYRIVIVKATRASAFTVDHAASLQPGTFTAVAPDNTNKKLTLETTAKDSDGDTITEDQPYVALIVTVGKSENLTLSKPSNQLTLTLPATPAVAAPVASDVSNFGNGRDLKIVFQKVSDESLISGYRIFVVKTAAVTLFTATTAENVPAPNFTALPANGLSKELTLTETSTDSEGQSIQPLLPYTVFVLTIGHGRNLTQNKLSPPSNSITLEIPPAPPITSLTAIDVANNGNARDIEISFHKPANENMVASYRLILVKEPSAAAFTQAAAEQLAAPSFYHIPKTGANQRLELDGTLLDAEGNAIRESSAYRVFIMSVADGTLAGTNTLSASVPLSLAQKNAVRTFATLPNVGTGGLQVDHNGNVYMGNFGTTDNGGGGEIYKITPSGAVSVFATGFNTTDGNDVDSQGNLFAISWPNTIYKITPAGTKTVFASNALINIPIGIAIDEADNLFVTCYNNNTLVKITRDGDVSLFSSSSLYNGPNGIDTDAAGNIYVSNWNDGSVIKVNKNTGTAELFVSLPSSQKAHLVIKNDVIYVAGRATHTIYRVTLEKQVTDFLGKGIRGDANGPLNSATISWPNDIAFNAAGTKMYVNMVALSAPSQNIISPTVIKEISIVE